MIANVTVVGVLDWWRRPCNPETAYGIFSAGNALNTDCTTVTLIYKGGRRLVSDAQTSDSLSKQSVVSTGKQMC